MDQHLRLRHKPRPRALIQDASCYLSALQCPNVPLQAQSQTQPLIDFVHERLISLTQNTHHERFME